MDGDANTNNILRAHGENYRIASSATQVIMQVRVLPPTTNSGGTMNALKLLALVIASHCVLSIVWGMV